MGKDYYKRGWLPATAGNLSLRDGDFFWITASGLDKGRLEPGDFLRISIKDGSVSHTQKPGQKPSAEASIHRMIYRNRPDAGVVLHVHNPDSLKIRPELTRENPTALWTVPPTELVKAMGFWEENPSLYLPIVYNDPVIDDISLTMENFLQDQKESKKLVPALMVENHGPSVWGKNWEEAHRHLEAMEYIMRVSDFYATRYL